MLCSAGDDSLLVNIDRRADLYSYARTFGVRGSAAAVEAVRDVSERIQRNANLRLALEVLMLDLPTR